MILTYKITPKSQEVYCFISEASTSSNATPVPKQVQWKDRSERLSTEELDILSKTLSGLADISMKKAQVKRHNRAEWFYHYLCGLAYLKEIVYICEKNEDLEEDGWKDMDVVAKKINVEQRLDMLQLNYLKHLRMHVICEQDNTINFEWLDEFQQFIVQCVNNENRVDKEEETLPEKPKEACAVSRENSLKDTKPEKKKPKTMDINKLQKAISKLVRNIAADIRGRYHRRLSEETMRRTVSCEIISLLSPISDDDELVELFERVIAEDEEPEEISTSIEMDIETSGVRSGLRSKRESSDSLSSCTSSPRHQPKTKCLSSSSSSNFGEGQSGDEEKQTLVITAGDDCQEPSASSQSGTALLQCSEESDITLLAMQENNNPSQEDDCSHPSSTSVTVEDPNGNISDAVVTFDESVAKAAGPPYNLPGVLTLWKSYNTTRPATLPVKPYTLQGFEELSPLTETTSSTFTETKRQPSPRQHITIYPLTPSRLYEMLAHILHEFGIYFRAQITCDIACELYKYALGLVYQCPPSNHNGLLIARILQKIGVLKNGRGEIVAGCQLLDEAMQVYKALPMKDKSLHIVRTWLDLGQAYLKEQGHVTSLFSHIMNEVRNELSQEFKPDTFHIPVIEESDDSDSSQGDSYSIHIYEAIDCLESALSELQKITCNAENKTLLVTILTKLADCHIVTGNYDKAIGIYEEVMGHCKNAHGSQTLENNAHVLSMLGICNFLLGHYPKAGTLLETASILQHHIYGQESNFGAMFNLTMLALNYYKMRQYHKCIIWCLKSNEKNQILYDCSIEEIISKLDFNRAWYIIQNMFTLGYAYYTLDFHDKAIHFLEKAKHILDKCEEVDIKQHVKLLKVIADTYVKVEWYESALEVYKSALTIAATIGNEKSSVALTNQLLNCMASVEVHVRHYSGAADYLEQALDHQKHVESSIKGDMIGLEYQLGKTYILSGDIDKAIDCFEECLESIREIPGTPGREMVGTLGKIANLYFVKGLMQDDNDYMNELLLLAQTNFAKAVSCDERSTATIYYANYLMQQGQFAEAVYLLLRPVFLKQCSMDKEVVFSGVEQALIPEHLSQECSEMDEVVFETKIFACFIVLLCLKQLGVAKDADDCLVTMYKCALSSKHCFSHILMGYAFLESYLFEEAAESFAIASTFTSCENIQLAASTSCLCYLVHMYQTMCRGFQHLIEYIEKQRRLTQQVITPDTKADTVSVISQNINRNLVPQNDVVDTETTQENFEEHVNMTLSSLESSGPKSRSDILNTSSHYESDSSFATDQSMMSDDSMGSESYSRGERDSFKRGMDNSLFISEDEVWETLDEKGNVIETRVVRSNAVPSTIYEVENNGNFTSEYDQTIHDLQVLAGETSNANYQNMVEIISTPQRENWSTTEICDNENIIRNETATSIVVTTAQLSSPKRKLSESQCSYPSKHVNKSVYSSSFPTPSPSQGQDIESESEEEEVWETFEETVDTPDILLALLKGQGKF